MRTTDDPNSVRYGRLSIDDISNKVPSKKDLFVICAGSELIFMFDHCGLNLILIFSHYSSFISCCCSIGR